jgi:hypothetical protein
MLSFIGIALTTIIAFCNVVGLLEKMGVIRLKSGCECADADKIEDTTK